MGDNEYYQKGNLGLIFDPDRDGYFLKIGKRPHFIDSRAYQDFQNLALSENGMMSLYSKFEAYDDMIIFSMKNERITPGQLEGMFKTVKDKRDKEFQQFKKANNL